MEEERSVAERSQPERFASGDTGAKKRETSRGLYWLLLIPFLGVLFPWIYNTDSPELFGIPFFYWYQMAWVPVSAVLTILVYRSSTRRGS
jgi:hypothetical protein